MTTARDLNDNDAWRLARLAAEMEGAAIVLAHAVAKRGENNSVRQRRIRDTERKVLDAARRYGRAYAEMEKQR